LWLKYEARRKAEWDRVSQLHDAEKRGIAKGIEQGIEQGEIKGLEKTAIELMREGDALEKVSRVTGLSIERLIELKAELEG